MKTDILGFIKKQWLLIWGVITAMSLATMFVSAEYGDTKSTMKRVVRATTDQNKMFSSNILVENGASFYIPNYKSAYSDAEKENNTYNVDIYLWNYNLGNISKWYTKPIDYRVTLTYTNSDGEALSADELNGMTVRMVEGSETIVSLNSTTPSTSATQTLSYSPSQSSEHHYELIFPGTWDLENDTDICVKVMAEPYSETDATAYQDLSEISAVIGLKQSTAGNASGWEAYLAEQRAGVSLADCDAYNLVATGAGKATVTLKWDNRYLECNKNFYNSTIYSFGTGEITGPTTSGNITTLIINADTAKAIYNNRNRYDIQFYKKATAPSGWDLITDAETAVGASALLYVNTQQQSSS